jgi:hypothetical protein
MYLKFIKSHDESYSENVIECANYEAHHRENGEITITTYAKLTNTDGVERHITPDENQAGRYETCFVMNDNGKTIERYRAKQTGCRNGCPGPASHVAVFDKVDNGIIHKKRSNHAYCVSCAGQIDPSSAQSALM